MKRTEKYQKLREKLQKEAKTDEKIDRIVILMDEIVVRFDRLLEELSYIAQERKPEDPFEDDFDKQVHKVLDDLMNINESR